MVPTFPVTCASFFEGELLYICIPAYNEAPTVGLVLWRLRSVLKEFAREYELVVYNDGSSDATAETLASYTEVLPLTVIGDKQHRGYAHALDALARHVATRTRYPRRDAFITMQADFTDRPEDLLEIVKRFEGGADIVVAEREVGPSWPAPVRLLRRLAPYVTRPFVDVPGVKDPFGTLRSYRISLIRDLIAKHGDAGIVRGGDSAWASNVELLARAAPLARRIETISITPHYELRPRETRIRPWRQTLSLFRSARTLRSAAPASS
jgi:glycosyltransferase involved in cell wall biosynthesis